MGPGRGGASGEETPGVGFVSPGGVVSPRDPADQGGGGVRGAVACPGGGRSRPGAGATWPRLASKSGRLSNGVAGGSCIGRSLVEAVLPEGRDYITCLPPCRDDPLKGSRPHAPLGGRDTTGRDT